MNYNNNTNNNMYSLNHVYIYIYIYISNIIKIADKMDPSRSHVLVHVINNRKEPRIIQNK